MYDEGNPKTAHIGLSEVSFGVPLVLLSHQPEWTDMKPQTDDTTALW